MLQAGFIGAGGRSQGAHYPSVNRLEDDVEMLGDCEMVVDAVKRYSYIPTAPKGHTNELP